MRLFWCDKANADLCQSCRRATLGVTGAGTVGGRLRDRIFAYASGPFVAEGDGYDRYASEVERLLVRGFRAIKPRAGLSPRLDGKMVTAIRRQIGDDVGLMVDINQGYTRAAALGAIRRMEEADLLWIEEPLQPEDLPGYRMLAATARTPIAGGEAIESLGGFRDALAVNAFSVLQPDPTVCGGFTGFQQIAALGRAHDLPVIPHSFGTIVGAMAGLHLAAVQPEHRIGLSANYPFVEIDVTRNPLLTIREVTLADDGTTAVPETPGIGLDLAEVELEPFCMERWSISL